MSFSSKTSTLFILVKLVNVTVSINFFITVFSNTLSKSVNICTEKISVRGEGSIQKRTRHHGCFPINILGGNLSSAKLANIAY